MTTVIEPDINQTAVLDFPDFEGETQPNEIEAATSPRLHTSVDFSEVDNFPHFDQIGNGDLYTLSLKNHTTAFTHGLHRFPAKFIPQIPRWAIRELGFDGATILDPFMGSGTTLVEGLHRRSTMRGTDIDPLARLISSVKATPPASARIAQLAGQIEALWLEPAAILVSPMPDIENFQHWFTPEAWGWLQSLLQTILALDCARQERDFLIVIFSSILRWVSNADDQSQKTYVSGTNKKTPPPVPETFWKHLTKAYKSVRDFEVVKSPDSRVLINPEADATALMLEPDSVDLIVTSPPYLDSVDYMYNFMLEYFWLGPLLGVPDRKTYNRMRKAGVGAKSPNGTDVRLPAVLGDMVNMETLLPGRQRATVAYFSEMGQHFLEAGRVLRDGGRYVLVIGNSQTLTGIMPVHDCLIRLASAAGLHLEKAFAYRIRRHYMKFPRNGRGGIILIDWVITLCKTTAPAAAPEKLPLPWVTLGHREVAH